MAAHKLTATKIDKYKPTKNDEILADGNGLYLRYRKGSTGSYSRRWMYAYKSGTKSIYLLLGEHNACLSAFETAVYRLTPAARLTLENTRKIAVELADWRKRGLEPKAFLQSEIERLDAEAKAKVEAEAATKKQIVIDNLTVRNLFDAWLCDGVRRKDGNAELQRSFKADVLPQIGTKKIKTLTEHELRAVLRTLAKRGVNRAAVVMRNNLMQMFAWAEKRPPWRKLLVDGNPMDLIEIEKIVSAGYDLHNQRDRILSPDEIVQLRDIFRDMQTAYDAALNKRIAAQPVEKSVQHAIWIMLSTLCRVGELSMARWEHVNFDTGEWFIPQENVKANLSDLIIYLSDFSLAQFKQLHKLTGNTEWCFPARNKEGHVCVKSISKQIGDRQSRFKRGKDGGPRKPMKNRRHDNTLVLGDAKNGAWTPHDLRRTGATLMQSIGVALDIIDRCQNHVLHGSKVRRHYLHHNYVDEKRNAWKDLGERLEAIVNSPTNVLVLRSKI